MPPIDYPDGYAPQSVHDCGLVARTVELRCPVCYHVRRFDPYALWWLFERRGWDDRLVSIGKRFRCVACWIASRRKVRPVVTVVDDAPSDDTLPRPDAASWKRSVKRRRT